MIFGKDRVASADQAKFPLEQSARQYGTAGLIFV